MKLYMLCVNFLRLTGDAVCDTDVIPIFIFIRILEGTFHY